MEYHSLSPSRSGLNKNNNKTTSDSAQASTQCWTATRCHRLLRPLLTHISALKKEKAWRSIASQEDANTFKRRREDRDSDSYRPEKKPCRKYSSRASRNGDYEDLETPRKPTQTRRRRVLCAKPASSRQEVVLPTPFLRRVKDHALSSSPNRDPVEYRTSEDEEPRITTASSIRCSHQQTCSKGKCVFEIELASLRTSTDPHRYGLFKSIFHAFDALLRSTSASKYPSPAAPRSLLAMCLRKVPEYVAELEYWDQKDAEERGTKSDKQVSFEVYTELEGLNPVSNGWRHLCAVVRAHGVRIIRQAILEEQLFDDIFTGLLIRLSLDYMPYPECVGLIDAYIQRPYPKPVAAEDSLFTSQEPLRPLRLLKVCDAQAAAGSSLLATKLAELLSMGHLPAKWILTKEFKAIWVSTAGLIVKQKYRQNVVNFIITTINNMCSLVSKSERLAGRMKEDEQPWDKAQNTLVGAIAALTSITLLLQNGASTRTRTELVGNRIKFIVDSCLKSLGPKHIGAYLLNLSAYLIFKAETALLQVQKAWARLEKSSGNEGWVRQYDVTTVFLSSVAYYCSRGALSSPTESLERLCDELETLQLPGDPFSSLRMDAAFSLADQTGDLRDLAFAEELKLRRNTAAGKHNTNESKRAGDNHDQASVAGGFRWDEGISEWVNISPVPAPPRRRSARAPRLFDRGAKAVPSRRSRQTRNKAPNYKAEYETEDSEGESESDDPAGGLDDEASDFRDSDGEEQDVFSKECVTDDHEKMEDLQTEEEDETLVDQFAEPQEPTPEPEEDEGEEEGTISPLEGDKDELEIPSPTLVNLFSSNRLRRPKKSMSESESHSMQQLPSSPPLSRSGYSESPKRRSIWSATALDDELCADSPSFTRPRSHKEKGNRNPHSSSTHSAMKPTIEKVRKVGSARTSLLSLQPKRIVKSASSSSIAVVLKTSTTSSTSAGTEKGFPLERTNTGKTARNVKPRRDQFWDLGDSSDADELSFL